MKLMVNGRSVELADGSTVAALLAHLGVDGAKVAVERNQDVITRQRWADTPLKEGDRVEIVTFVGGG